MTEIESRISKIVSDFNSCATWEDRYKKIIQVGKTLPELSDEHKIPDNIIKGCQSQVWLVTELSGDKIIFKADSDAMIVKGLVSLLVEIYSGSTPDEILSTPPTFLKDLGFESNLSPSRANGLHAMIKQISNYAIVYKAKAGM